MRSRRNGDYYDLDSIHARGDMHGEMNDDY